MSRVARKFASLLLILVLSWTSVPLAGAPVAHALGPVSPLPELVFAKVAQGANLSNVPYGTGVKFNSSLAEIIVSLEFAEDVYGRVVETRLYNLKDVDEQPARLAISAGWDKRLIMQATPFIRPLNLERWPAGRYEGRIYADGELLKVFYFEFDDEIPRLPNEIQGDVPVFDLSGGNR